jgi:5-methyltetrahydropteroyltriglutamate--homocysteine methyltransferase
VARLTPRRSFHLDFLKHIDGVVEQFNTLEQKEGHKPPTLAVTAKIAWPQGGIEVRNFEFLQSLLPAGESHRIKITMPSPTMLLRGGREAVSTEAYPDLADFYDDLVAVYRAEIDALYQAGCRYIQFDDTNLAYLTDPTMRQQQRDAGEDVDTLPARYVALINRCISPRPDDLTTATHVCKGNYKVTGLTRRFLLSCSTF